MRPLVERAYASFFAGTIPRAAARRARASDDKRAPAIEASALAASESLRDGELREWSDRIEAARTHHFDGSLVRVAKVAGIHPPWGRALAALAAALGARRVLEVGTGVGISTAYLRAGMQRGGAKTGSGRGETGPQLITIDLSELRHTAARKLLMELGLVEGVEFVTERIEHALREAIDRLAPIDLVFIDATKGATAMREYVDMIAPHLSERGVLAIDDIRWQAEMRREWSRLRREDRWALTADLWRVGLLVPRSTTKGYRPSPSA